MARTESTQQTPKDEMQLDLSISSNQDRMSVAINNYSEGRDLINKEIAHIQYAMMNEDFSRTVRISKLARIKQHKYYRNIAGMKNPHSAEILKGTWEDFCLLMNRSVDQMDRDIANFNAFGEEALDSMMSIGIGYRELAQLRKLPEDAKAELIEVAKEGDKTELLNTAQNFIAKQAIEKEKLEKEKETLNKQLEETKLDLESSRKVLSSKDAKINELSTQLEKKALIEPPSVDEQIKQLRHEVNLIAFEAESIIRGKLRAGFEKLNSEYGMTEREVMAGWIGNIRSALNQLAGEFDLPEIPEEFEWTKED